MQERLQKILANAGVASRRMSEELIIAGRVSVNGRVVRELGSRADASVDEICLDGEPLKPVEAKVVLALHKPAGVISAMSDDEGRMHLGQFVKDRPERLFHVGRLDLDSEGLILLTNDGDLANRLSHPKFGVPKRYLVWVSGALPRDAKTSLLKGVDLEDGLARVTSFHVAEKEKQAAIVDLVIKEGRNRIVRRMFEALGTPVDRLIRTEVGPVKLGELKPGRWRVLSTREVDSLRQLLDR